MNDFRHELARWPDRRIDDLIALSTAADVRRAIAAEVRTERDLAALLSPVAREMLEAVAQEAHRLTRHFFGRTIGLYAPIYISNLCAADCVYCNYAAHSQIAGRRTTLSPEDLETECRTLAAQGFKTVLLLTGEAPKAVPVDVIARAVRIANRHFSSVGVEIYALDAPGYAQLVEAGLESVTLYQETYDRETYREVHLSGDKTDFDIRLRAIERAGHAGVRRLSAGALLGLTDWRHDGFRTALHARYLQKACWQSAVSVSFPRLKRVPTRYRIEQTVSDRDLVQLMLATRLFVPQAGFNLSTREPAVLRDHLIPLGVTMMSAGSSTRPGGYATRGEEILEQFGISDERPAAEVVEAIQRAGYDPVGKDFDAAFHEPRDSGPFGPSGGAQS